MLDTLIHIATEAGDKALEYYHSEYTVHGKKDNSPVTDADLAANEIILAGLEKHFSYPILSEETKDSTSRLNSEYLWLVDPIDGTKDFIQKTGDFAIMIGLAYQGKAYAGVVHKPATQEWFIAKKDEGAYKITKDGVKERLFVSNKKNTSDFNLVVSRNHFKESDTVVANALGITDFSHVGSVGIKICTVASQKADLYIYTHKCNEWDTAAPHIILEEAGGTVTDMHGNNLTYNNKNILRNNGVIASNGQVHETIIDTIQALQKNSQL